MSDIILTEPIPGHSDLERLHLFAGRHLGEEEFERQQAYVDRRIEPLLGSANPGILNGLQVRSQQFDQTGEGFTVSPGLAIAANGQALGLYYPLRQRWSTLIEDYLAETHVASAAGVFYLTLRRTHRYIDSDPDVLACQRDELDPMRDARRLVVGNLGLKRLAIDPSVVASNSRALIENWVAANNVDAEFLNTMNHAVPLGLLAVTPAETTSEGEPEYVVNWFSQASGRYRAIANGGYHVLLYQVNEAFRRVLLTADDVVDGDGDDTNNISSFINDNLQLDFLPASGELPKQLLQNIATPSPSMVWLPGHLGIDMIAVPEESVNELIERHLPRRVIDLREPAGDQIRLLLAVNEPDYKPDLLDYPQTDKKLQSDIFRYFMRAYNSWLTWMKTFNHLYALTEENVLGSNEFKSLDLPEPVAKPQLPRAFYRQVIDESVNELGTDEDNQPYYPYNEPMPEYPEFYRQWATLDSASARILPPAPQEPETDGLVIQYTLAQIELEALDNEIRAIRSRVEKTRDYLLLQRQQLDSQTVALAALAGGVAGDGSGLQVARWLPFTKLTELDAEKKEEPVEPLDASGGTRAAPRAADSSGTRASKPYDLGTPNFMAYAATATPAFFYNNRTEDVATKRSNVNYGLLASSYTYRATTPTVQKKPSVLSSVQFNLNNQRIKQIAQAPKQALTKPAYKPKEFHFGVLEHIRPEIQEYKKAYRGMSELITTLQGIFDPKESQSIRVKLNAIGKPKPLDQVLKETATTEEQKDAQSVLVYEALFDAGKILSKQIALIEGRYTRQETRLESKLRARITKEGQIEKLVAQINKSTQQLENLDKRRIEYLGDYGVAQRLLDEDWLVVYQQNQERTRVLTTALKGLYYVRVRQTGVSLPLADPLNLRHGKASDIVPGCDWEEDADLPEELEDFFDTVLEVPMNDWFALRHLRVYVPPIKRLEYIAAIRTVRFKTKLRRKRRIKARSRPLSVSLFNTHIHMQSVLSQMATARFPLRLPSAKLRQKETAKVLSLEDVLSGTKGHLQKQGQLLRNRLEQASYCLLEKLNELPPSIRLQWAQLAEDDQLSVENVERWPGLEGAERDDFNATRSIAELIEWWFRQISSRASAEGRSAMRNMIRACVIHSALGDPNEILQGVVHVPPRRLALGEPLRLRLNRVPNPGTILQLMDPKQRIVAMLNVSDHDQKGSVATITKVTRKNALINTRFRVVASKLTKRLKY